MLASKMDPNSEIPALVRVKDLFRTEICSGRYLPGAPLPSIRTAGRELGVHHLTVAEAYRRLAADGLIRLRGGVGAFVAERPSAGELLICTRQWESSESYLATIVGAIARRGRIGHCTISSVTAGDTRTLLETLKARAESRTLRGVWLGSIPGSGSAAAMALLAEYNIPVVHLSDHPGGKYFVGNDLLSAIRAGTRHLIGEGCRHVALLGNAFDRYPARVEAFRATCEALGARHEISPLPSQDGPTLAVFEHHGSRSIERLFSAAERPDGLLITDDYIGRGAMTALLRLGIRVPDDLRVCTLARTGSGYPSIFGLPVARIEIDSALVSAAACDMMERLIEGKSVEEYVVRLMPRLVTAGEAGRCVEPANLERTAP